jgi:hypothetical protein
VIPDTPSPNRNLPEFTSLHSTAAQSGCDVTATRGAHHYGECIVEEK